jgi:hypothetical protein
MRPLALVLLLAGCTTLPADPAKMSAEQLKEWVRDKNATMSCASAKNAAGNLTMVSASLDKGAVQSGSITVTADCVTTITSSAKAASAP